MMGFRTSHANQLEREQQDAAREIFAKLKISIPPAAAPLPVATSDEYDYPLLHKQKKRKNAKAKKTTKSFYDMPSPFSSEDEGFRTASAGSHSDECDAASVESAVVTAEAAPGTLYRDIVRGPVVEEGVTTAVRNEENKAQLHQPKIQEQKVHLTILPTELPKETRKKPDPSVFPYFVMGQWNLVSCHVVDPAGHIHRPVIPQGRNLSFERVEGPLIRTNYMSPGGPVQVRADDEWLCGERWSAFGLDKLQFSLSITENDDSAYYVKFYVQNGFLIQFEKNDRVSTFRRYARVSTSTITPRCIPVFNCNIPPPPFTR